MNVLLIYPEFPLTFWTFPKVSHLTGAKMIHYPLGLITVAALLPQEWNFKLVDLNTRQLTEKDWNRADLAMISAMLLQKKGLLALVHEAKQRGKTTVVGGPYPTTFPDEVLKSGCDFLVRWEAENSIALLLKAMEKGKSRVIIENDVKPLMSVSPVPRFDLLNLNDYMNLSIQTSRGCPFECEFCDIINLYGRKQRYKDPDQVIKELETLYGLGARGNVFICDDNFIGNRARARRILQKLTTWNRNRGQPFSFTTQVSVNLGQDPEMIDLMTAANFGEVFIGVESPDEDVLALNRKYPNIENPLVESLNNIVKNGLVILASFIIGFDGEKTGVDERICAFVEQTGIPFVMPNLLQAPPNTPLWQRLKREGRLIADRGTGDSTFTSLNYSPTRPESEIMKEYADAWEYLYEPSRYLARAYRYYLTMRPTRRAMAKAKGKPLSHDGPKSKPPLRTLLRNLRALLLILYWQGIRPAYRRQFWRQLIGVWKQNPSRMMQYFSTCAMGENMFYMKSLVRKKFASDLENPEN